jgi:hypothetical protein
MPLPQIVREVLSEVGQAAVEVSCQFEGCREFVSVYRASTSSIAAFHRSFPYYGDCDVIFRIIRFRADSQRLANDEDLWGQDLLGLQEIYVPSEDAVEFILNMWKVPAETLVAPRNTEIPV